MIYLDNAATTLIKPAEVEAAVTDAMHTCANAGRGGHSAAMCASRVLFECREAAGELFGVGNPENVIFTMNTTHALNIAIKGALAKGGHCVISSFEHNSVTRPLRAMVGNGVSFTVAESRLFDPQGTIDAIKAAIRPDTVCVVCTQVSNAFGYRLPIEEIDGLCQSRGIPLIIDAAQSAGSMGIRLDRFKTVVGICVPGHKGLYGPQGTGLLLCRHGTVFEGLIQGGTGSLSGSFEQPDFLPDMHESGTQNIHGIAGLCQGIRYVGKIGAEKIGEYERDLTAKAAELLGGIKGVEMYAPRSGEMQTGVLSFNVEGKSSEITAALLGEREIAVRGGLHCAPLAHKSAGTPYGAVRVSVSWFNDEEEILCLARAVRDIA